MGGSILRSLFTVGVCALALAASSGMAQDLPMSAAGPAKEQELVVIPQDWRETHPFSARFPDTEGAEHVIDLAAMRFATDPLVTLAGRKTFREPDLATFPPSQVRQAFAVGKRDLFIVQATDPKAQTVLRRWLERVRIPILGYVPHEAYLVRLDERAHSLLSAQEAVFWIGLFQPAYRVAPDLDFILEADPGHGLKLLLRLDLEAYPSEEDVRAMVGSVPDAAVVEVARTRRDWIVRVDGPVTLARTFSVRPGCLWVERFVDIQPHNSMARTSAPVPTGRGASAGPILDVEDVWARGIRGEGQIAAAADSGLSTGNNTTPDSLHFDFGQVGSATNPMRVIKGYVLNNRSTWDDNQLAGGGHGTHTSGSIVGNGFRSGSNPADDDYATGYAGIAPKAEFVFQSIMQSGGGFSVPADLNKLFYQPYKDGARVHSNSWGSAVAGQYTAASQTLDEFVWDHPDMVITFSAGNSGEDGTRWNGSTCAATGRPIDGVVDTDSIGAPGTAKNCITVGASENYRPNFVYQLSAGGTCNPPGSFDQRAWGWGWCFTVDPILSDKMCDNASGMAAFSSRGPTDDVRFKPDLVAPGAAIASTRTDVNQGYEDWGECEIPAAYEPYYVNMGGTSMSNPLTAGAATLVRQYFVDGWHANGSDVTESIPVPALGFNPSAALVKATLINGAWDMAPGQYGSTSPQPEVPPTWDVAASRDFPNNAEGYGRVDVEGSLFPHAGWGRNASRRTLVRDVAAGIGTGGRSSHSYSVSSSADPLIATLVWTDPSPISPVGNRLVNNLDLEVTSPSGRQYTTNRVNTYVTAPTPFVRDTRNNVEQVKVTAPETGTWTIDVYGTNVPGTGVGGTTTQPFALVVSAVSCVTPGAPVGVAAVANGNNRIDVSWSITGAAQYHVYRGTASGSATTLVGTVGGTSFADTTVAAGTTYFYVVRSASASGCESAASAEVSATAGGSCWLGPDFAGLASVTFSAPSTCGLGLSWAAATASCGGPVSYSVYRDTFSAFTPGPAYRIAAGLAGTSFTDSGALAPGATYYYVVRATDEGNGVEETNTIRRSGRVLSGTVTVINETFAAGNPPAGWAVVDGGTGTQTWTTTNPGRRTVSSPLVAPVAIIDSLKDGTGYTQDDSLISPAFSALGATAVSLTFDTYYNHYVSRSTAYVDASADGGNSWSNVVTWTATQAAGTKTFDITSLAAGSANVKVRFRYVGGSANYWLVDNVRVAVSGSCWVASKPAQFFTARSASGANLLEWQNPANSSLYNSALVRFRTDTFPTSTSDGTEVTCPDQDGFPIAYNSCTHPGLTDGTTYFYSLFMYDGGGVASSRRTTAATPFDTTGAHKWSYSTGAASLAPPGVLPGAIGTGAVFALSNDRALHAMNPTDAGGGWPRSGTFDWTPAAMNGPAQHRPPVVPLPAGPRVFLASQDGYAYAVNAATGAVVWTSVKLGDVLQANPAGFFSDLRGDLDLLFVGTRNATSANALYALNPATGMEVARFDNGEGAGAVGIITGITVDYATERVYFTSRAAGVGSSDTLWCLDASSGSSLDKLWSLDVGDIDGGPVLHLGRVYVGTNSGAVHAIDPTLPAPQLKWTYSGSSGHGAVKGYVFPHFGSSPLRLYFATTSEVWAIEDNGDSASLAWSAGTVSNPSTPLYVLGTSHLLVGSGNGTLYQLATGNGAVTGSLSLGTSALGSPTRDTVNELIHVGSTAGVLHTVALPLP
jgi:outer membrane protein assembly factor BamB